MITKQDLLEAIAECQGTRSPNANTAVKLAAFYTILDHMNESEVQAGARYSFAAPPNLTGETAQIDTDSEFAQAINGKPQEVVLQVFDELMSTLQVLNPRLYRATLNRF